MHNAYVLIFKRARGDLITSVMYKFSHCHPPLPVMINIPNKPQGESGEKNSSAYKTNTSPGHQFWWFWWGTRHQRIRTRRTFPYS